MHRCAILDDYQNVALGFADWTRLRDVDLVVFNAPFADEDATAKALHGFSILCAMRERTPFPQSLLARLPDLKLLVTTGMRNASIDIAAAQAQGVTVCGTDSAAPPTAELAIGLMLELARNIGSENARMHAGETWQRTVGITLEGKTLGILGLGRLGARVATVSKALGMRVIAWSQNLTPEKCAQAGAQYVSRDALLAHSDFISIHLQLSERTRGLIGAHEFSAMKPSAFLINTSRGPIVDEVALIAALRDGAIAGAGLDVYDQEPLPRDHPLRALPNAVLTPHLGYVTAQTYDLFYGQTVEAIAAFLDGKPVRVLSA